MDKFLKKDPFEYCKERERFLKDLYQFHCNRGTPYQKLPNIQGKAADLYLLYSLISSSGGYNKVNDGDKWEELVELFDLPRNCANGSQALKQIYMRYLYLYERMHLFGDDPDHAEEGDDYDELPTSSSHRKHDRTLVVNTVPMTYNYRQHHVDFIYRQQAGLSTNFVRPNQYAKLEKSLLCGLPNEVDFALNVCTWLSSEGNHTLRLLTHPRLLDLLLAHVGIFTEDSSLKALYDGAWSTALGRNFTKFWNDSTEDRELLDWTTVMGCQEQADHKHSKSAPDDSCSIHFGRDLGVRDIEGQRVLQVVAILRNLSFEGCNARLLASSSTAFRFMLLCASNVYSSLKQNGLELFSNVAARLVLKPVQDETTQLVFRAVHKCLASNDKFELISGLEIIASLARVEENEEILSENLSSMTYDSIVSSLKVKDIQLIACALDALYHLSELGNGTCDQIARTEHSIDLLVDLVTVEAQSFGDEAIVGIRVMDETHRVMATGQSPHRLPPPLVPPVHGYRPPISASPLCQNMRAHNGAPASAMPGSASMVPPLEMTSSSSPPVPNAEVIACNWIHVNFEPCAESTVNTAHMLSDYMTWLQKKNLPSLPGAQQFINCVKFVFPSTECLRKNSGSGSSTDVLHVGIRRREMPSAVLALPSVGAASPRSSTPHMSASNPAPAAGGSLIQCNGDATLLPQQPLPHQSLQMPVLPSSSSATAGVSEQTRQYAPRVAALTSHPADLLSSSTLNVASITATSARASPPVSASSALKNLLQSRLLQNHDVAPSAHHRPSSNGNGSARGFLCGSILPLIAPADVCQQPGSGSRCGGGNGVSASSNSGRRGSAAAAGSPLSPRSHSPRWSALSRSGQPSSKFLTAAPMTPVSSLAAAPSNPRLLELQICGEAEKACEINIAAAEAKIERVENLGACEQSLSGVSHCSSAVLRSRIPYEESAKNGTGHLCNGVVADAAADSVSIDFDGRLSAEVSKPPKYAGNGGCGETTTVNGHGGRSCGSPELLPVSGDSDEAGGKCQRKWPPRGRRHLNGLVNGVDVVEKRRSSRLKGQPVSNGLDTSVLLATNGPCNSNDAWDSQQDINSMKCDEHFSLVDSCIRYCIEDCGATRPPELASSRNAGDSAELISGQSPPPEKRQRTASIDSQKSSSSSSLSSSTAAATARPGTLATPVCPPSLATFACEWASCGRSYEVAARVRLHVIEEHLQQVSDGCCPWEMCDNLKRQRWSLVSHIMEKHCSEVALKASLARRQQPPQLSTTLPPASATAALPPPPPLPQLPFISQACPAGPSPAPLGAPTPAPLGAPTPAPLGAPTPAVYAADAAKQAIMRNVDRPPYSDLLDAREGPVTKHFRFTSVLILRNVARYSSHGRSLIKKHENTLSYVALSSMESSSVASNCLWDLQQQHSS